MIYLLSSSIISFIIYYTFYHSYFTFFHSSCIIYHELFRGELRRPLRSVLQPGVNCYDWWFIIHSIIYHLSWFIIFTCISITYHGSFVVNYFESRVWEHGAGFGFDDHLAASFSLVPIVIGSSLISILLIHLSFMIHHLSCILYYQWFRVKGLGAEGIDDHFVASFSLVWIVIIIYVTYLCIIHCHGYYDLYWIAVIICITYLSIIYYHLLFITCHASFIINYLGFRVWGQGTPPLRCVL